MKASDFVDELDMVWWGENDSKISNLSKQRIELPFIEKGKAAGGNVIGKNVKNFNLSTDVNVPNGPPL